MSRLSSIRVLSALGAITDEARPGANRAGF